MHNNDQATSALSKASTQPVQGAVPEHAVPSACYPSDVVQGCYKQTNAFSVRHSTPFLRATQRAGDIVATAPGDLCDGCKTTERHASDSAEHDRGLQENYAILSITSLADSEMHMLAGACSPPPTACHGCSPVRATSSSPASIRDIKLPSGLSKNNGKPTIDRNFFKSMAKTIKANRASKADAEVVDEEACTHYTGNYTSNSCAETRRHVGPSEGGHVHSAGRQRKGYVWQSTSGDGPLDNRYGGR
jgi:hypothetical protein